MNNSIRKIIKIAAISVFVIAAILVWASLFMIDFALKPGNDGKDVAGSYEYMFNKYPYLRPWVDSLNAEGALKDTFIVNEDGIRLHALYIAAPEPTANTAVVVHGYTDSAVRMLHIGQLYNKALGYNVLLPDLYGSGSSQGEHIRMGWLDRLDVLRWMDIANLTFGDSTRMVVHGISMGAATTMMVSGEPQKKYVRCFVEDCGYTSVWDQFSKELKSQFGLPEFPLLYSASAMTDLLYGWNFREASPFEQVKKSTLPMMFIHGSQDDYVPTWMVYPLYEAKPGEKELWVVPGSKHALSYHDYPEEYTSRVGSFVNKYMK